MSVNQKVAEIIKRELERGRIIIERKIIEEQKDKAVREKLKVFNDFIFKIRKLGEKPPKSSQRDEYILYRHKIDELICIWRDELLKCLPGFAEDELREFIEREVKGGKRCFVVALMLAERKELLNFGEIAKSVRLLKSFAGPREKSLNKTLSRTLEGLKNRARC